MSLWLGLVQNVVDRCPKWVNKVLIPQSRDQSVDWRIAGVLKFEKAGKQENDKLRGCLKWFVVVPDGGKAKYLSQSESATQDKFSTIYVYRMSKLFENYKRYVQRLSNSSEWGGNWKLKIENWKLKVENESGKWKTQNVMFNDYLMTRSGC